MSVDRKGAESAQPLLFNKDKVQIWLKYPTGATRTFQRTRDFMLPVGDSSEKKKRLLSPNGYRAQTGMKWESDKRATLQEVKWSCRD